MNYWTITTHSNVDESHRHTIEWKKPFIQSLKPGRYREFKGSSDSGVENGIMIARGRAGASVLWVMLLPSLSLGVTKVCRRFYFIIICWAVYLRYCIILFSKEEWGIFPFIYQNTFLLSTLLPLRGYHRKGFGVLNFCSPLSRHLLLPFRLVQFIIFYRAIFLEKSPSMILFSSTDD